LQGEKSDMLFCIVISGIPKFADRKFGVIPSLRLRTASEHFFCHSDPERSEGEESDTFPSKQ